MQEDRCQFCRTLIGVGIPEFHLGVCDDCRDKKRARLRELYEEATKIQEALGIAAPGEVVWQHEGLSRRYLVIGDGLGGGTAQETDDTPYQDQACVYNEEHFPAEEDAIAQAKRWSGEYEDEE